MTTHITKEDLKKDALQTQGLVFMDYVEKHAKLAFILIGVALAVGVGFVVASSIQKKGEISALEDYYKVEKAYQKKKDDFKEAKTPNPMKKSDEKSAAKPLTPATGDLEKDYGPLVSQFKAVIQKFDGSKAAAFATLNLVEIYTEYNKNSDALALLEAQKSKYSPTSLVGGLLLQTYGTTSANEGKCKEALSVWDLLGKEKSLKFMTADLKIRMALCHEALGDMDKAKGLLQEVAGQKDLHQSAYAKHLLRLMNMQKTAKGS